MGFWLKVVIGYLIIAVVIILVVGWDFRVGLELLLVAIPFLVAIIRHIPRLYLFLSRLRYYVTNHETIWRLALELDGTFQDDLVGDVVLGIIEDDRGGNKMLNSTDRLHVFRYKKVFTVEVAVDEAATGMPSYVDDEGQRVSIIVLDQKVSYRSSRSMIEDTLIPLFERLWNELKPDKGKYTLRIGFEGQNPFFGLYIQQMKLDAVREFTFEFKVPTANEGDYVRVAKEEMTVVSSSLDGLRKAAMSSLTFSTVGRQ